jgi:crotonobetainyl-CoA:carnitine CoA-transferase CaiB-like acyl-CoA transferase
MAAALSGITVLDLSRILAGPWSTQILADLGADVIKIERPGSGDDTRSWGPPYLRSTDGGETRESAYYASCNRGKRSVAVDIATAQGQDVVRTIAKRADVVVENFKAGDLARYRLGYADLAEINPRLVYCSITGFGHSGPYRQRTGYDFMIQGLGGLMSVTGERDDLPGGGPQKVGVAVADLMTGLYATVGILAALRARDASGRGQHIDMALLDCQVAALANMNLNYFASGQVPRRWGNAHPNLAPYEAFATRDGHVILAAGNDGQFAKWCAVAGCPDLARDPRFAKNDGRVRNRPALIPLVRERMREKSSAEWIAALEAVGVPCGPINDLSQVFADPQVVARGIRFELPHPTAGTVPMVASPLRLADTPPEYRRPPPTLGQHTAEVLAEVAGLDGEAIERLRAAGIVQ